MLDSKALGIWSFVARRAFGAEFLRPSQGSMAEFLRSTLVKRDVAVYVHIPFCTGRCLFCPYTRITVRRSELRSS
ncbi:MAG: hypothetical protein DRO39_07570 [Thermoprotei archaeon]|nr:MAG: hypothetical protein DRO39_07570 [Thermoprotei archaeon]